ncbi:MAG TPA: hydrogenase maturation protease [Candidatus Limnocylindrales bacterium]|nr:hydrogenase maturation protease [Candidatus Limnocylindrales bacterium]
MNNNQSILIAGVGNIFLGDDAYGVEVVRELAQRDLAQQVHVIDFGIRAYDLAYALTEPYEAIILVDAVRRGALPGTLYLIEPDLETLSAKPSELPDAHSLDVTTVLQMAQSFGGISAKLYLVGCEPGVLENPDGDFLLTEAVRTTIPQAIEMIESLVGRLIDSEPKISTGVAPV